VKEPQRPIPCTKPLRHNGKIVLGEEFVIEALLAGDRLGFFQITL
jgi:hypothetical protein